MKHPKDIGDRTTLAVMLALRELGYGVLVPFGENTRYDLVIDDGDKLARVQCKTGRLRNGVVQFKACSTYAHHSNPASRARNYLGQIDYFGVHCPQTAGVYLVPIEDVPLRWKVCLRVGATRNGQQRGIRYASDYEIGRVAVSGAALDTGRSSATL